MFFSASVPFQRSFRSVKRTIPTSVSFQRFFRSIKRFLPASVSFLVKFFPAVLGPASAGGRMWLGSRIFPASVPGAWLYLSGQASEFPGISWLGNLGLPGKARFPVPARSNLAKVEKGSKDPEKGKRRFKRKGRERKNHRKEEKKSMPDSRQEPPPVICLRSGRERRGRKKKGKTGERKKRIPNKREKKKEAKKRKAENQSKRKKGKEEPQNRERQRGGKGAKPTQPPQITQQAQIPQRTSGLPPAV